MSSAQLNCACQHPPPPIATHTQISSSVYWRKPFSSVSQFNHLTEFMVLDINPIYGEQGPVTHGKFVLADATVARMSDLGENDTQFEIRTHLGHILQPGDLAWG